MKDAYAMEDKEVLDRLANMHINFQTDEAFKKYHNAMQLHDMNYLRYTLNDALSACTQTNAI
ncbi:MULTISPECIES: hypothetical protein [Staphylococcus]|uniref:hypothetical protein n=1 Tax=Staphylococcus TaxID=1279 RepID=UPI000254ADBC|nr:MULTISPECIES: hypothetical protein [Staphylococcus]EHY92467.1 hypothetical protein SSME_14750 [Staphylococcus saprophyticus subsp. saprophyticus KACC 16562]KIJ86438.1 hypothetical protein SE00_10285 [Staphylococcus saprophyticus]MBF2752794.1 hypothetical protein [Staphylococcus saprophyticus]MBF2779244.1 hypothetical protein [Staphylococcus saprophyticus]MBF2780614.1 hypothetical protein [Staphylococcus saprophyticus]